MKVSFCGNHASIALTHDTVTGVDAAGVVVVVVVAGVVVVVAGAVVVVAGAVVVVDIPGGQSSMFLAVGATTLTIASAGSAATINVRP